MKKDLVLRAFFCGSILLSFSTNGWCETWPPSRGESSLENSSFADRETTCKDGEHHYLKWKDAPIHDFGPRVIKFDATGMRQLRPPPPAGVHPRLYLCPEDLPDLRQHFLESESGKLMWKYILCYTETMKGRYDQKASYTKPDYWKGWGGWVHGPVPLMGLNHVEGVYQKFIAGDENGAAPGDVWWGCFSLEALRCLVMDDAQGARDLAAATITAMHIAQKERALQLARDKNSGPIDGPVSYNNLPHIYDLIYNYLTPEQKREMHDELANCSWHSAQYGSFEEATAARSTWATFTGNVLPLFAIEGEPGFNEIKLDACYRAWRNYLTYSINRSGCIYEGEGKLVLGAGAIMAFSQRPRYACLGAHPNLRRYADYFLPHDVVAHQKSFMGFDLYGGASGHPNYVDVILMHYLYPHDPRISWVYRLALGEGYRNLPENVTPWADQNDLLFAAIFATDFDDETTDPSQLGLGTTFFDGERALLMTRSDWSKEAVQLTMQTREVSGGHPYADRNSIQVIGAGRVWSSVNGDEMFENQCQSVVVIDGKKQGYHEPGRIVDFQDNPLATFIVGDAKYSWDWTWDGGIQNHEGWIFSKEEVKPGVVQNWLQPGYEIEPHRAADFHYTFKEDPVEQRPLGIQPSWVGTEGSYNLICRKPLYPVKKAFRTAGLVRGVHPYILVLDDIQKDDVVHHYDWILQLEKDVKLLNVEKPLNDAAAFNIYLEQVDPEIENENEKKELKGDPFAEIQKSGKPKLLIKVLQRNQDSKHSLVQGDAYISDITAGTWNHPVHRLIIPSDSISPDYKVMMYPYREGDLLPQTSWTSDHNGIIISWSDQKDQISFAQTSIGKTNLDIFREAKGSLVNINKEVLPLQDPVLEARMRAEVEAKSKALQEFSQYDPGTDPGIVAYWDFDQAEADAVVDHSSHHLHLSLSGHQLVDGQFGRAIQFKGEKEGLVLPINLSECSNHGFTILMEVKGPDQNEGYLFSNNGAEGLSLHPLWGELRCDAMGKMNWLEPYRRFNPSEEGWRKLVFTWDGKIGRLYLDGQIIQEKSGGISFEKKSTLGGGNFMGSIDQLMIFKRALSLKELKDMENWEKYILGSKS